MKVYHYHHSTGVFLGESLADESPLEPGVYLVPANSTNMEPPEVEAGEYVEWDGEEWAVKVMPDSEPDPAGQTVPLSITPRQGELTLIEFDLYDPVKAYFDALPGKDGAKARTDFYRATEWKRDWPLLVNAAKSQFGLTDSQIDQMFIYGASL